MVMPTAVAKQKNQVSKNFVRLGKFASSKLIQNLGTNKEQFNFRGNLRDVWGRD